MTFEEDIKQEKEDLIDRIREIMGFEPPNARILLRALAHPSLISETRHYFEKLDVSTKCTKFEAPWNCAREAEAHYENISYGWLGAGHGIGYSEWWCEPCKRKVMGT